MTLRTSNPRVLLPLAVSLGLLFGIPATHAKEISPQMEAKINAYKQKLSEWAANPAIVNAVKEANSKGTSITNEQWQQLSEQDPKVSEFKNNAVGKLLTKWEADKTINKLFVRDAKGNLVAGNSKPALYNIAEKPSFNNAIKGQAWADSEVKPDPTTKIESVQLSVPVKDGSKIIGIIHTSITAQ